MMIYQNTPPAWSFHPKRDTPPPGKNLPGPGQYDPDVKPPALLAHFPKSGKLLQEKSEAPGPGTYDTSLRLSPGRSTTLGKRYEPKYDNAVPGPGSYDKPDFTKSTSPIRFQMSSKDHSAAKPVPGPGEYNPSYNPDGPKWSFSKVEKMQLSGTGSIGPGSYDADGSGTGKGITMGARGRASDGGGVPGPGSYDDNLFMSSSLPGFPASKSRKEASYMQKSMSPGPGEYDPMPIRKSDGNYQLGKSAKLPWEKSDVPGPGHYDPNLGDSTVKVSLHPRLVDLEHEHRKQIPGPGHYSPMLPEERRQGSVFLPKAPKEASYISKAAASMPAPGDYDVSNPFQKKGFSFTKAGKFVMEKGMGPYYEIPSSIGIIQNYHKRF